MWLTCILKLYIPNLDVPRFIYKVKIYIYIFFLSSTTFGGREIQTSVVELCGVAGKAYILHQEVRDSDLSHIVELKKENRSF